MTQLLMILGIVLAATAFGVGLWTAIVLGLRRMAGLSTTPPAGLGPAVRSTGWGSAYINRVRYKNCVTLAEHADGWLISTPRLFGGGSLWLPRDRTAVGPLEPGSTFRFTTRRLTCDGHVVVLSGKLAEFVG